MQETPLKADIHRTLTQFTEGALAENARTLLATLGYESQRTLTLTPNTAEEFIANFDTAERMHRKNARLAEWQSVDFLFQLTADEIRQEAQETMTFKEDEGIDDTIYYSYLFFAVKLTGDTYSRTALANITRNSTNSSQYLQC